VRFQGKRVGADAPQQQAWFRHRLRLELLPSLERTHPAAQKTLSRFFHLLRNAGNHHASVGVTDQNNVIQLLPLYFIGDIKNVGIKIEVGLQQMGAFADLR
jgi:hypothetical protein